MFLELTVCDKSVNDTPHGLTNRQPALQAAIRSQTLFILRPTCQNDEETVQRNLIETSATEAERGEY